MVAVLVHAGSSLGLRAQQAWISDSHTVSSSARRLPGSRQAKQAAVMAGFPGTKTRGPYWCSRHRGRRRKTGKLMPRSESSDLCASQICIDTAEEHLSSAKNCSGLGHPRSPLVRHSIESAETRIAAGQGHTILCSCQRQAPPRIKTDRALSSLPR